MKRLIKKSMMTPEMFESNIKQLSDKGRAILRSIEDYKFTLEQTARLMVNDQQLSQKLIQKRKSMEAAAGQVFSVVFDIENIDITTAWENQVTQNMPSEPPTSPVAPPNPNQQPPQPPQQQGAPAGDEGAEGEAEDVEKPTQDENVNEVEDEDEA